MSRLDAALAYIDASWSVFPCRPNDKAPATSNGLHAATTDADSAQAWWGDGQSFNIGVACEPSGLAVVDVDDPHGLDALIAAHGPLPPTLEVATPRGGRHLIYAGSIKSTTSKLARGVDTRGRGGYIVVPPSTTPDGAYVWANQLPIAPLPPWLAELADPPRETPELRDERNSEVPSNNRWGQRVLDAELGRIAVALEGERNATLFEAACNVYEAVKGGHIDEDAATERLTLAAERAGLDGWEVDRTLASAWDRVGERHPKGQDPDTPTLVEAPPLGGADDDTEPGFEVLSTADLVNIPPPQYLVPERVPEGLTVLAGLKASGKTFTALDWSATVAATQGPVVYFVGEGFKGFAQRVQAWEQAHQSVNQRLHIVRSVPRLLDADSVRMLYTTVRRARPVLVVIDTLARATPGVNENDAEPWTRAIDVTGQIMDAYETSTLLVHHTGANGNRLRGHTSLDGAADAIWLTRRDEEAPDTFHLVCDKMKDDDEPAPLLGRIMGQPNGSAIAFPSELPRSLHGGRA